MGFDASQSSRRQIVRLFPLPNVVLFPRAILPLHIFEQRYREMTSEALATDQHIAMALLKPKWEKCHHASPAIDEVVCIGTIRSHEQLNDGRFNLLLQGITRARIIQEIPGKAFRVAEVERLIDTPVKENDLAAYREKFEQIMTSGVIGRLPLATQLRKLMQSALTTSEVADVLAFHFVDDLCVKQSLLIETDVLKRIERVIRSMSDLSVLLESASRNAATAKWN